MALLSEPPCQFQLFLPVKLAFVSGAPEMSVGVQPLAACWRLVHMSSLREDTP